MLNSAIWASRVGDGGAPPAATWTVRGAGAASGWLTRPISTVGAALKWVTPSSRMWRHTVPGSRVRNIKCVPPTAVTAHGKHQPLQWNMGSVHRNTASLSRPHWAAMARALRLAPRCEYITPLGWPVVPDV